MSAMGQVGTVADWTAPTHPQEEASIRGGIFLLKGNAGYAARPRSSQENRNLDFNVKVSWPLWRTVQIGYLGTKQKITRGLNLTIGGLV